MVSYTLTARMHMDECAFRYPTRKPHACTHKQKYLTDVPLYARQTPKLTYMRAQLACAHASVPAGMNTCTYAYEYTETVVCTET